MSPKAAPAPARDPVPEPQTATHMTSTIEAFIAEHPDSLLLEDGHTLFDLRTARYSLSSNHDRATFHLWSDDRNLVRSVLSVTPRAHTLRLSTQRFGRPRPQNLDLVPDKGLRTPTDRESTRQRYLRLLDRVLLRAFPDLRPEGFRSAMDLERSFGPAYARGTLIRGQHAWAVIAVNSAESQATIDGILTIGILWLQHCRDHAAASPLPKMRLYGGLRLILPRGAASATLARLAWLNPHIANFELFELDEQTEDLTRCDPTDHGNLTTRLIHAPNVAAALDRFAEAIPQVLALLPPGTEVFGLNPSSLPPLPPALSQPSTTSSGAPASAHRNSHPASATPACELRLRSNTELAFLLHGLEFARIRSAFTGQSFNRQIEITVGSGPSETALLPDTQAHLREFIHHLFRRRRSTQILDPGQAPLSALPPTQDILFRTQPERWLESTLRAKLSALDPELQSAPVYTQVPAFTGAGSNLDRGMLDLLAVTRSNHLAVIEIKAAEDLHLALQGLDYWIRVRHHHLANLDDSTGLGDLQHHGYFPHTRLSPDAPTSSSSPPPSTSTPPPRSSSATSIPASPGPSSPSTNAGAPTSNPSGANATPVSDEACLVLLP